MLKSTLLALVIGLMGIFLVVTDSEARRMGGGKSLGRSAPSYSRQADAPSAAQPSRPAPQAGTATTGSRWGGPLAGLLAGGLIGALLFGGMFEGLQFMDLLIFAALAFGVFWLFKTFRRGPGQPPLAPREAHATVGGAGSQGYQPAAAPFAIPEIGGARAAPALDDQPRILDKPSWFKEQDFLRAAKTHFIRLQAAWDKGDMKDIREYTTPQLFADLTLERQAESGRQFTEVVELNAELIGLVEEQDQLVASVRYSGQIREQEGGAAQPFSEIWHIQRARDGRDGNWHVAGIQQEADAA
ncbi:MAG: TIM44-like domain-containing protein [Gammaproteobacteria bacterium]